MKYSIRISPVQSQNSEIPERMGGILGILDSLRLEDLVRNGGIVKEDLSRSEAGRLAGELRRLGVAVEVIENTDSEATNGYQVTLISVGKRKVPVIKEVREITGLGLKEAKELVDNLGVVGIYKTKREADRVKKILKSVGAKATIIKLGGGSPEPKPDPQPEPGPENPPNNDGFLLFGQVRLPNGYPPDEACTIRAFDRDLRSEQFLGESLTDRRGSYRITYTKEQFKRAEKGTADLVVRVYNSIGKLLSESAIHFNAPPEARINLLLPETAPVEPSEYERLVSLLTPLLEGVPLTGLTSDDVWFLANETGHPLTQIAFLADDARLAERTGMPQAVFFGLAVLRVGVIEPEEVEGAHTDQRRLPVVDLATVLEEPVKALLKALKSAIEKRLVPIGLNDQLDIIEERFSELMSSETRESVGSRRRRVQKLGQIAGLPDESAAAVARRLDGGMILPEVWGELVSEGVVAEEKIGELQFTVELGALTEDNLPLTEALKSGSSPKLGRPVTSLRDLAVLESADWEQVVVENRVAPPGGKSSSEYAASLAEKVEKQFPTEVFRSRVLGSSNETQVGRQLQGVHSLLEVNAGLFSKAVSAQDPRAVDVAIDFGDRDSEEIEGLRFSLQELEKLARTFRHLGVAEIMDRTDLPAKEKAQTVGARLGAVDAFLSINKDVELKSIDFFGVASNDGPTPVSYAGIHEEIQPLVRQQMMAHQRVMNVAPDAAAAVALLQCGFDSAMSIAAETSVAIARKTGLGLEQARDIRTMALDRRMRSLAAEGALFEANPSSGSSMRVVPPPVAASNELKKIDGYADQFGSQNYCSCRHCASVLGPAAYFVDLMRFVEKHVLNETFQGLGEHDLHLRQRRPDLGTLPLTCHNTNTLIPYLDIINSVLEQYIQTESASAYELLSKSTSSFSQPFHLPLEELRVYLQHFGLDLSAIAEALRGWGPEAARESLRFSPEEWALLTQPDASDQSVYGFYGWRDAPTKVDVQSFLKATGVTRPELDRLIALESVIGTDTPIRVAAGRNNGSDLQPAQEELLGLTVGSLSRIHRFVRLWQQLPWEMEGLDYVLRHWAPALLDPAEAPAARSAALGQVATLRYVQRQLRDVALDVLLSLVGPIPLEPFNKGEASLFDRLFNGARLAPDEAEAWSPGQSPGRPLSPAVAFRHPALAATNQNEGTQEEVDEAQDRLLGALGVSDAELEVLLSNLLRSEADDDGTVDLTHENLSLLHRHAKLAARLGLSAASLFTALRVIQPAEESSGAAETLADLRVLLSFLEWQRESGLSIADIHFIVRGPQAAENGYRFEETILQVLTSHKIDEQSAEKDLLSALAKALGINQEFLRPLFTIADQNIEDLEPFIALTESIEELRAVSQRMEETIRWVAAWKLDVETLQFIASHPDVFGLELGEPMALNSLRLLSSYTLLRERFDGKEEMLNDLLSDPGNKAKLLAELVEESSGHVRSFLDNISPEVTSDPAVDPAPVHGIDRLMQLLHAIDLGRRVGLDGRAFKLFFSHEHRQLAKARDLVLGAFRAKYEDDAAFEEAVEPFRDRLRGRRRDALVDFILTQPSPAGTDNNHYGFETSSDLYHYFLLDTELEGCARTSRIVAATNSVQLYVHRCLMGLEQSKSDAENPVHVIPTDEMLAEWPWRKNYRVWEANRKVFLHTENFLDPDLRDNKTPLFRTLEEELLQQDINADTVEAAYLQYLKEFTEIANLKIIGSCYDEETRTTHVFGKSRAESGRLFHRKMVRFNHEVKVGLVSQPTLDVEWTPWEELEVKADIDYLSPIVIEGQLHLLWVERRPRTATKIRGGSADTEERSDYVLKVSRCMIDGGWSQPDVFNLHSRKTGEDFRLDMKVYPFIWGGELRVARGNSLDAVTVSPQPAELSSPYSTWDHNDVLARISNFVQQRVARPILLRRLAKAPQEFDQYFAPVFAPPPRELIMVEPTASETSDYAADFFANILTRPRFIGEFRLTQSPIHSLNVVLNSPGSYIAQVSGQSFLLGVNHFVAPNNALWYGWKCIRLTTPVAETLAQHFYKQGLDVFLSSVTQKTAEPDFPVDIVRPSVLEPPKSPDDHLDFAGPYGVYYRELFLHIPLLLANHLNANQRFEEAQRWYHYVFNPVTSEKAPSDEEISSGVSPADHYWNYLEFKGREQDSLREILRDGAALEQYRRNPFNPHAVARMRLNAYKKSVVMMYLDNLIDWGDHLFTQDTRESINEATLLYVMAADILGDRPVELGSCEKVGILVRLVSAGDNKDSVITAVREITGFDRDEAENIVEQQRVVAEELTADSAKEIQQKLEAAGATVISEQPATSVTYDTLNTQDEYLPTVENVTASVATTTVSEINQAGLEASTILPGVQPVFCVPYNQDLLAYWDRVGDRLFKIRNCMNLSGVRRELALFAPPIDPALLVRARAAGLSLEDALALGDSQVPLYRFVYLTEKAKSYAATVQAFGNALLSALEKKDAEELMLLRATHQQNLLALTTQAKEQQIKAAGESLEALKLSRDVVQHRKDHYAFLLGKHDLMAENLSVYEKENLRQMEDSTRKEKQAMVASSTASILFALPQLGAPTAMTYGGAQLGNAANLVAAYYNYRGATSRLAASKNATLGSYWRREQEWTFQEGLAEKEIAQLDQQILGAEIQVDIAERELEIHQQTIEQEEEVFDFYRDKFSNFGLFTWLSTELRKLHRMAYNMAHEVAQMAQAAYRYERDMDDTVFIQPGHWDSRKAGLLAGNRLMLQLQQMEKAFIENNEREYEITKHVSIAQLDPLALVRLRSTGTCDFEIPEVLYDMDHPGQYCRRLKSVSLSLPCIAGPYTSVSAKLSLTNNQYRKNDTVEPGYAEDMGNDARFAYNPASIQSIATSTSQNDSGVFELNFRDERYLPFEYAGAISRWTLELPTQIRQFDYESIADVVVHVKYTAREGKPTLKSAANDLIKDELENIKQGLRDQKGLHAAVNLKHELSNQWNMMKRSGEANLVIDKSRLPYIVQGVDTAEIEEVIFIAKVKDGPNSFSIKVDDIEMQLDQDQDWKLCIGKNSDIELGASFTLFVSEVDRMKLEELIMVVKYTF